MRLFINSNIISEFLSGVLIILALMIVGGLLAYLLKNMAKHYPFTRLAVILALTPVSLMQFLGRETQTFFFLYAMIVALLGILIDGIKHLIEFKAQSQPHRAAIALQKSDEEPAEEEPAEEAPRADMLVWEKVR